MLSNSEPLPEGTVIMAENQYQGRGQQGNTWHAEPGKNLTFSLLLYPGFLPPEDQFSLNMVCSTAVHRALKKLTGEGLRIKWPNDIYFRHRKIGGMLIENILSGSSIKASIIGIGINVNQEHFEPALEQRAASLFQILHEHVNLVSLLAEICSQTEAAYLKFREGRYPELREEYLEILYLYREWAAYRQNGENFSGKITGISPQGKLMMETGAGLREYNFKEIEFIQP